MKTIAWCITRDQRCLPLVEIIKKAVEYYTHKFGTPPTHCFIRSGILDPENIPQIDEVIIDENAKVPPDHLWIGTAQ